MTKLIYVTILAAVAWLFALAAVATAPAEAAPSVSVQVARNASLSGSAIVALVTVSCSDGASVLEAQLTVSQDNQATSGTAGIAGVVCDGRPHRYTVTVNGQQGAFHTGPAHASAFVLVQDSLTGGTASDGASRTISVR